MLLSRPFLVLFLWQGVLLAQNPLQPDCRALLQTGPAVDYLRDWGVRLLENTDPAFSDPGYLKRLLSAAVPGTVPNYGWGSPYSNPNHALLEEFHRWFDPGTETHHVEVLRFTSSGTEANNVFYELAEQAFTIRTGQKAKRVNLLYLGRNYGGTFGRIAEIGGRYTIENQIRTDFEVPAPQLVAGEVLSPPEAEELEQKETKALELIRRQVSNPALEVGGIFLEPISAFSGVLVYRSAFLRKLRELADELRVPIFADEILTGGGRTGEFWAFLHYGDFEPDAFSFGKGLVVSGVAHVHRTHEVDGWTVPLWQWAKWNWLGGNTVGTYPDIVLDNTSRVSPLILVQATAVLKRIREARLQDAAKATGTYFLERARAFAAAHGQPPSAIHGVGLLLYGSPDFQPLVQDRVRGYRGRWTPALTLTSQEIDRVFALP
jgi:4-aminobutyrate aminotransferase-like enzyme